MAMYHYQASDISGKARKGLIEAASEKEAREKLRLQKVFPTEIKGVRKGAFTSMSGKELHAFTLQLCQLLQAGLPLYESLLALEAQYRTERWHGILQNICSRVKEGDLLSVAMAHHPQCFDTLYCSMIAAGESTGSLFHVCEQLTRLIDRQLKIKKQISQAMIYPALLSCFALLVIILLLSFVVPSMENLFENKRLGGITAAVFSLSHIFCRYWLLGLAIFLPLTVFLLYQARTPKGKAFLYAQAMKLPPVKAALIRTAIARFSRTMGTLQQGGVALIDSLKIARHVMRSPPLQDLVKQAEKKIMEGSPLSAELTHPTLIPPLVTRMLAVGEETGAIGVMFHKIADLYEEEVEKSYAKLTALMQPVILLIMGGIVGLVMIAVLLPLTDMNALAG